jgi:hypothetical protein
MYKGLLYKGILDKSHANDVWTTPTIAHALQALPQIGRANTLITSLVYDTSLRVQPPTSGQLSKGFQNYAALPQ